MSLANRATVGMNEMKRQEEAESNQGKRLQFSEVKKHLVFPVQVLDEDHLPKEILDLKKSNPAQFLEERVKRCSIQLRLLDFWLDSASIKPYNEAEMKAKEMNEDYEPFRLFPSYQFQVDFNKDNAADYVDEDPIAWFFHNLDRLQSKMTFPFSSKGAPKIRSRVFTIVQDMNGAERILEMSFSQFKAMSIQAYQFMKAMKIANFRDVVWEIENVTGKLATDSTYTAVPVGDFDYESVDFERPEVTTIDLETHYAYGISPDNVEMRRTILEKLGLEPYFPATAKWLAATE